MSGKEVTPEFEGGGSFWWWVCSECHTMIYQPMKKCPECGGTIRWSEAELKNYGDYILLMIQEDKEKELNDIASGIVELMKAAKGGLDRMKDEEYVRGSGEITIKESEEIKGYFSVAVKFQTKKKKGPEENE